MRKDWINTDLTFQRADKPCNEMYYLWGKIRTKQKYMANNWGNQSWIMQIFVNKCITNVSILIYQARIFCISFTHSTLFFIFLHFNIFLGEKTQQHSLTILVNLNLFEIFLDFQVICLKLTQSNHLRRDILYE